MIQKQVDASLSRLGRRNPRAEQMAHDLKQKITAGDLQPGEKLPSFRDLATQFKSTYRIAQAAVEHLEQIGLVQRIQGSGTYVTDAPAASNAKPVTSDQVHLIFAGQPMTVAPLIQPLMVRLQTQGLVPVPVFYEQKQGQAVHRLEHILRQWEAQPPRAIVIKSANRELIRLVQQQCPAATRVISVYYTAHADRRWDRVQSDEFETHGMATRYLLGRGHRHIGLVTADRSSALPNWNLHEQGMAEACSEAGADRTLTIHRHARTEQDPDGLGTELSAMQQLVDWLQVQRPTAVVGTALRLKCLQVAADEAGMRMGEDFEVVGIGDPTPAHRGEYVCIGEPYERIAQHAIDLINAGPAGGVTHHVVVPPLFVPRCVHRPNASERWPTQSPAGELSK